MNDGVSLGYGTALTGSAVAVPQPILTLADSIVRPQRLVIGDITIDLETHEVAAPNIEAASEAGRIFVESIRSYLR